MASVRDNCIVCSKKTYLMDRVNVEEGNIHKTCLKCKHCNATLSLGNFCKYESAYYCNNNKLPLNTPN